jgi:3-oxoacyl-[acyl-carrier-protein] synthase-3
VSAASIPIALFDAVRDGAITGRTRVFAPGFGAGAVGGYAVLQVDPAIVADEVVLDIIEGTAPPPPAAGGSSDDMQAAFGG